MYIPHRYKNDNLDEVRGFIHQNSFGLLISQGGTRLTATHIPLGLDKNENGKDILAGHISRGNPQWKNFADQSQVLAVFSGPHAYISSSWYDHENVPTWNYIAVHVYGTIKIVEGERLVNMLSKLVRKYEAGSKNPVAVETMDPAFLHSQVKGIVGFEIEIEEIQAAYKLSQNRDAANHASIVHELEKQADPNAHAIAAEMKRSKEPEEKNEAVK